jgi:hypothetical protein
MSVADVYQDERLRLMPNPRPFDGYIEHPARVSSTSLISFQRNRYNVPCEWINAMVSVRVYHDHLMVVSPDGEFIRLKRCFDRDQTLYDWTHYIALIERKPGALRNGAPFKTMPRAATQERLTRPASMRRDQHHQLPQGTTLFISTRKTPCGCALKRVNAQVGLFFAKNLAPIRTSSPVRLAWSFADPP